MTNEKTSLPCEAKVADLEHAVGVDQKVSRLDVPMDDLGRVQVLNAPQNLVEEYFNVVLGQVLRRDDDLVQVGLHELSDHVDFLKEVDVRRLQ